jgi:nicotinate phosphoribosyltransferase
VVKDGKLVYKMPTLMEIKAYAEKEIESFWDEYKRIDKPHIYKVDLSDGLYELKHDMLDKIRGIQKS